MDTLDKLKNGSTSQALIYFSDVLPFLSNASIALFASLMACEGRRKVLKKWIIALTFPRRECQLALI